MSFLRFPFACSLDHVLILFLFVGGIEVLKLAGFVETREDNGMISVLLFKRDDLGLVWLTLSVVDEILGINS